MPPFGGVLIGLDGATPFRPEAAGPAPGPGCGGATRAAGAIGRLGPPPGPCRPVARPPGPTAPLGPIGPLWPPPGGPGRPLPSGPALPRGPTGPLGPPPANPDRPSGRPGPPDGTPRTGAAGVADPVPAVRSPGPTGRMAPVVRSATGPDGPGGREPVSRPPGALPFGARPPKGSAAPEPADLAASGPRRRVGDGRRSGVRPAGVPVPAPRGAAEVGPSFGGAWRAGACSPVLPPPKRRRGPPSVWPRDRIASPNRAVPNRAAPARSPAKPPRSVRPTPSPSFSGRGGAGGDPGSATPSGGAGRSDVRSSRMALWRPVSVGRDWSSAVRWRAPPDGSIGASGVAAGAGAAGFGAGVNDPAGVKLPVVRGASSLTSGLVIGGGGTGRPWVGGVPRRRRGGGTPWSLPPAFDPVPRSGRGTTAYWLVGASAIR